MSDNALATIPTAELQTETSSIVEEATSLQILTQEDLEAAGDCLKEIKALRAKIAQTFDGPIQAAHAAHKAILAAKAEHDAPLVTAEGVLKGKTGKFLQAQEAKRQEAQRRAQEAAEAAEAARRQAEAEKLRQEAQERAKQAATKEAKAAILAEAKAVANEITSAPIVVAAEPVQPVAQVKGVTAKRVWKFRIVDAAKIPIEYMVPNEKAIGAVVRAMGAQTKIPGVQVFEDTSVAVRTK